MPTIPASLQEFSTGNERSKAWLSKDLLFREFNIFCCLLFCFPV